MTIRHPRLLQDLPRSLDEEQIDELLRTPDLRIERIVSTVAIAPTLVELAGLDGDEEPFGVDTATEVL